MITNVSMSQIYWNNGFNGFHFREQAMKTLDLFINSCEMGAEKALNYLDVVTDDMDLDDVEEDFYEMSVSELSERFGISLVNEEEDDV